ncbi:MAG: cation transporter [Syntrophobacter sp.]
MRTIKVKGMSCQHCVKAVTKALQEIETVGNVAVSLEKGEVSFDEKSPVDDALLKEKVKKAGFEIG